MPRKGKKNTFFDLDKKLVDERATIKYENQRIQGWTPTMVRDRYYRKHNKPARYHLKPIPISVSLDPPGLTKHPKLTEGISDRRKHRHLHGKKEDEDEEDEDLENEYSDNEYGQKQRKPFERYTPYSEWKEYDRTRRLGESRRWDWKKAWHENVCCCKKVPRKKGPKSKDSPQDGKEKKASTDAEGQGAPQGDQGKAAPQGDQGQAAPQGDQGQAAPQGDQGQAAPQGDQGQVAPQGDQGRKDRPVGEVPADQSDEKKEKDIGEPAWPPDKIYPLSSDESEIDLCDCKSSTEVINMDSSQLESKLERGDILIKDGFIQQEDEPEESTDSETRRDSRRSSKRNRKSFEQRYSEISAKRGRKSRSSRANFERGYSESSPKHGRKSRSSRDSFEGRYKEPSETCLNCWERNGKSVGRLYSELSPISDEEGYNETSEDDSGRRFSKKKRMVCDRSCIKRRSSYGSFDTPESSEVRTSILIKSSRSLSSRPAGDRSFRRKEKRGKDKRFTQQGKYNDVEGSRTSRASLTGSYKSDRSNSLRGSFKDTNRSRFSGDSPFKRSVSRSSGLREQRYVRKPKRPIRKPSIPVTKPKKSVTKRKKSVCKPQKTICEPQKTVCKPQKTVCKPHFPLLRLIIPTCRPVPPVCKPKRKEVKEVKKVNVCKQKPQCPQYIIRGIGPKKNKTKTCVIPPLPRSASCTCTDCATRLCCPKKTVVKGNTKKCKRKCNIKKVNKPSKPSNCGLRKYKPKESKERKIHHVCPRRYISKLPDRSLYASQSSESDFSTSCGSSTSEFD